MHIANLLRRFGALLLAPILCAIASAAGSVRIAERPLVGPFETLQAAVHHGLGKPLLLPLFLDREVDVKLRLLVLRALHGDPATLEEAVKFRVTEVMEPRELQDRIKAARKAQKG